MRQNAAFATRLYAILLHLYPSDFRQLYGDEMTCIFEESFSEAHVQAGTCGVLKLWLRTFNDLAISALAERASRFISSLGIEERSSLGASIAIHTVVLFAMLWMGMHAGVPPHPSTVGVCGQMKVVHSSSAPRSLATVPRGNDVEP